LKFAALIGLLLAGCGPVVILWGLGEATKSDNFDPILPEVAFTQAPPAFSNDTTPPVRWPMSSTMTGCLPSTWSAATA